MNINQEQLIIFQSVMETGSFSAAARKLGKVPSAVSMSIANMEIDLNLNLFERKGREPVPTPQAHVLYEKSAQLLIEMNQWKQQAFALSTGLESALNIVIVSELLHTHWVDYIRLIEQKFPTLQINIISAPQEDALAMLLDQSAQLAFMFEREHLDHREQFVEIKKKHWLLSLQINTVWRNLIRSVSKIWCSSGKLWWQVVIVKSNPNCYFPSSIGVQIIITRPV